MRVNSYPYRPFFKNLSQLFFHYRKMSLSPYDQLLLNLAERCSVSETKALRKSKELMNLLNSKRSLNCSEICKVLVCLELAAFLTSVTFSRDTAVRLSGCSRRNYVNNFNNISKLLNLSKTYTVKEICLLVGAPSATDKSQNLLKNYESAVTGDLSTLEHPMYPCAAILAVCEEEHHPLNLSKLVDISKIKRTDLKKLSKKFSQLLKKKSSELPKKNESKKKDLGKKHLVPKMDDCCSERRQEMSDEKFEDWKRRMLEED